jgi:hypothetical protein
MPMSMMLFRDGTAFDSAKCSHKCGKCGARVAHRIPFGPALAAHCDAPIFICCLQCHDLPAIGAGHSAHHLGQLKAKGVR